MKDFFFASQKFKIATRMCGMGHLNSKSQGFFFFCKSHTHFNDFYQNPRNWSMWRFQDQNNFLLIEITY